MSPSATPATHNTASSPATKRAQARPSAPKRAQARHQSQPNAISATPATQSDGGCRQVPRLPRKVKVVDAPKCHACHTKYRGITGDQARHRQPAAISATPATQSGGECRQVPCLPRKVPRHQSQPSAISAMPRKTLATQSEGGCRQVPRLPRKVKVDAAKCHACHTKYRGVTGDQARPSAPPSASPEPARCDKCSACHAKYTAAPAIKRAQAPPEPAQCHKCHTCHAKRRWMSPSATPAPQNEGGRRQIPRLPRETKVDVAKCHVCHAKYRGVTGDQARPSAPKRATRVTLQIDRQIDRQTDR